jgi:hypothetical protein
MSLVVPVGAFSTVEDPTPLVGRPASRRAGTQLLFDAVRSTACVRSFSYTFLQISLISGG